MKPSLILLILFVCSFSGTAQDLEPRSYSVSPKGLHAAALSYTFSKGDVVADFTSPVQDVKVTTSIINAGYVQTFPLFHKLSRIQIAAPIGFLNGTGKLYGIDTFASRNGLLDAKVKFGMNLFGSPVLAPKDFRNFVEHTVLGASIIISVPIGQYYKDKLINLGTNRWGFKPELGISRRISRWYFEFYSGLWFFTNNNSFLKSSTLSEKPLFAFQGHVDYVFKSAVWVAINAGFANGGETSLNGVARNDDLNNWRIGGTISIPINKHQSIKAMLNTGVITLSGQNYTAATIVYQYVWFSRHK